MSVREFRDDIAIKILAGLCANPAVFAGDPQSGWSLVNCNERDLCAYAIRIANTFLEASCAIDTTQTLPKESP